MNHKQSPFHAGIPGSGARMSFQTLSAILRSVAPELLDCPDVIHHIHAYLGIMQQTTIDPPSAKILQKELEQSVAPPKRQKAYNLMIVLDGMKCAVQEYGLSSAQVLDAFTAAHKEEFEFRVFGPVPQANPARLKPKNS